MAWCGKLLALNLLNMLKAMRKHLSGNAKCAWVGTLILMQAAPAFAAYNHPVTWSDMSSLDLKPVLSSQYASESNLMQPALPQSANELVLRDSDSLINPQFHVSDEMLGPVSFWLRIYTEWTTQHVVIFDAKHPEIIYEVLDFRELAKTARNRIVYEIVQHNRVKKAMAGYRAAFARLSRHSNPKKPTQEEKSILRAIRATSHKHKISEFAQNLRTQTGQRDNIVKGLLAAESFFPRMERAFAKVGVPPELTRLALVESSFDLKAKSRVGAAGVWQFMPKSAKEYMRLDEKASIDERLSPLKSTVAAAKLLKRNYAILGNWAFGVTAYNSGHGKMARTMRLPRDGSKVYDYFNACTKVGKRLGHAGRNYYAEFLAVLHAEAYRHLYYGETPVQTFKPAQYQLVSTPETGLKIAMSHSISIQEFQFLNPDIRDLKKPLPRGFWVAVPSDTDDLAGLTEPRRRAATQGRMLVLSRN